MILCLETPISRSFCQSYVVIFESCWLFKCFCMLDSKHRAHSAHALSLESSHILRCAGVLALFFYHVIEQGANDFMIISALIVEKQIIRCVSAQLWGNRNLVNENPREILRKGASRLHLASCACPENRRKLQVRFHEHINWEKILLWIEFTYLPKYPKMIRFTSQT